MEKWMASVLAAILLGPLTAMADLAEPLCGDVNNTDSLTSTDALLVLKKSVLQPITLECAAYDALISSCETSLASVNSDLTATTAALGTCNADLEACQAAVPPECPCFDLKTVVNELAGWNHCGQPLFPEDPFQHHILCSELAWDGDDNCNLAQAHVAAFKVDIGGGAFRNCSANIDGTDISLEVTEEEWTECRDIIQVVVAGKNLCCQWNDNVPSCF